MIAGNLLARLTTPLDVDAYAAALSPRWGTRVRGVMVDRTARTDRAASIRLRVGRAWRGHVAGQHVTIGVDVDGVRHHRSFSISSAPDRTDVIEITIQANPDGIVSRYLVERAPIGTVVQLDAAAGEFVLPDRPSGPLLFVTAGSGITPVMSMLRALASRTERPAVTLVHHAPDPSSTIFGTDLARLAEHEPWLDYRPVHTRRGGRHLDVDGLARHCADWTQRAAFVCGPSGLLDWAVETWAEAGVTERLHLERFAAPIYAAPPSSGTATVAFARDGGVVATDAATPLLEVAEAAGLAPPFGCRMGICHTCSTRVLAGCARDLRDGSIVEAGAHAQLCVTTAIDHVVVDL